MLMHPQEQGELQRTDQPLDLALDGDGLLLVKDKSGALGGTRTGAFHSTKEGYLQDSKGLTLQGWPLLPEEGDGTTSPVVPLSAAFVGPLGNLEDIQLIKLESAPPKRSTPPNPFGIGWSTQKEADGLYSLHHSAGFTNGALGSTENTRTECTFVDSLGQERSATMYLYGNNAPLTERVSLVFTNPNKSVGFRYWPESSNMQILSNCTFDRTTEQTIVVTFADTGAELRFNLSDVKISSLEAPDVATGETVPWKASQIVLEEGTDWVEQKMAFGVNHSDNFLSCVEINKSEDGSFTARLFLESYGVDVNLSFDEKGGVSGYKFTENGGSANDPSVGVMQTGAIVKGVHLVDSDNSTDYGAIDIDFGAFRIINRTGSDIVINGSTIKPEASGPEERILEGIEEKEILEETEAKFAPSSLSIDENGVLSRLKDNGDWEPVYLLACGRFAAMDAAEERNGVYYATPASGAFRTGVSGKDGFGTITSRTLERSTTDLAHELSEMIRAQHAYAANTKVLSTIDDMLEELERL
jgi:flagellar hook protein FlgE